MESTTATLNTLPPTKEKKSCKKAITVNLKMTKYTIVKQLTLEVYQWKSVLSDEWDITWSDYYISEDFIRKLLPHQKINHFPGSYLLCKKNFLASHLLKIQQNLPEAYDFFPKTWILPFNYKNLQEYAEEHNYKKVFIAKPEASRQGRGIFLTKKVFKTLNDRENYVVQEYLKNPYLIDDYKFDLRLYVLIKNVEPLKIFLFQDGLARFATEKFQKPRSKNFMNLFMHLTNYSINKKNSNFQQNTIENGEEFGHKRSFVSILAVNFLNFRKI
jgi:tubulin polyglutamylase TTLL6/13